MRKLLTTVVLALSLPGLTHAASNSENTFPNGKPFAALQFEIETVAASVDDLESWVTNLQSDFDALEEKTGEIESTLGEIAETVDGLEASIENIYTDVRCSSGKVMAGLVYQNDIPTAVCVPDGYSLGAPFELVQSTSADQYTYYFDVSCPANHLMVEHSWGAISINGYLISRYLIMRESVRTGLAGGQAGYSISLLDAPSAVAYNSGAHVRIVCAPRIN